MNKIISVFVLFSLFVSLLSCQSGKDKFNEEEYMASVKNWQQERLERLKSENGWLNLVGLYWLKEGQNPFGSNEANNIIFPEKAPDFIGNIILYKGNLSVQINDEVDVFINDSLIKERSIQTDYDDNTTMFILYC